MERTGFRFSGKIPEGEFEVSCTCGWYSFNELRLISAGQKIICPKCGTEYEFAQQTKHWHLFIDKPNRKKERV